VLKIYTNFDKIMDKQRSSYYPPSFGGVGSSDFSEINTYHQRNLEQQPFQSGLI
jgi:hypothetical protein